MYRRSPFAATAEAPWIAPYTSTVNKTEEMKTNMLPHAKGIRERIGTIQCTSILADQANQKMPTGRPMLPIIAA
jgi:hypothetical protein